MEWVNFWVWSANMFNHNTGASPGDPEEGLTLMKVFFQPPGWVPASNSVNAVLLVVDFFRTIGNPIVFDTGFANDLGIPGVSHRDFVACDGRNIPLAVFTAPAVSPT